MALWGGCRPRMYRILAQVEMGKAAQKAVAAWEVAQVEKETPVEQHLESWVPWGW